jgi:hypothetical protein
MKSVIVLLDVKECVSLVDYLGRKLSHDLAQQISVY